MASARPVAGGGSGHGAPLVVSDSPASASSRDSGAHVNYYDVMRPHLNTPTTSRLTAINTADIRRVLSQRTIDAGTRYLADGRVLDLHVTPDGQTIEASVQGSESEPYRPTIRLQRDASGALVPHGFCTCYVGADCKHVAAVLLYYQAQTDGASDWGVLRPWQPEQSTGGPGARVEDVEPAHAEPVLPYEVEAWLRSLGAAQEEHSEDYPATVKKRLLYVIDRAADQGWPAISTQSVETRRDGSIIRTAMRHEPEYLLRPNQQPKFLRPSDLTILPHLLGRGVMMDERITPTLRAIIGTGRGRWATWDGPVLTEGEPEQGALEWILADDGSQRAVLTVPEPLLALPFAAPWYVDPTSGVMGPIETDLPAPTLKAMLASPAMPAAIAARVQSEMARRFPGQNLPAPKPIAPPQVLRNPLRPSLLLFAGELPFDPVAASMMGRDRQPPAPGSHRAALARLSWRYGPITLPAGEPFRQETIVQQDGLLFRLSRDSKAESHTVETLHQLGLTRVRQIRTLPPTHPHARDLTMADPDPAAWLDLVLVDLPNLRQEGWQIEIADEFPWRLVEAEGEIAFEIIESSGIDWFDLDLGVMLDGQRISLVPALLDYIAKAGPEAATSLGEQTEDYTLPLMLPLPDGRLLTVPWARLQPILAPLMELFAGTELEGPAGTLRLSRRNAGDLALLEAASVESGLVWEGGEAIRALGRKLREHDGIPACEAPPNFGAALRPYQSQGVAWLQFLRSAGLGGVLADDMGLGKTVQALAHLALEQAAGRTDLPSLVICPTSLVANWLAEATRFAPALRTLVLHGPARAARFGAIVGHDLVITTYPLLARDHAVLAAQDWHIVALDEAQTIKNPGATTSKLARTLRARQRLCLSGTPLENHLGELWSLFDFLAPGFLGNRKQFGKRYRTPIEKAGNSERQTMLVQRIAPFLLRRTKEEVASDLPPKTEITETVEMEDGQSAMYEAIRLAMHAKVRAAIAKRGMAGSGIIILEALLRLRQVCCDPRLLKSATAGAAKAKSAKLDRLLELLPQMLDEGRRVLLFSQFTSMLALIEAELAREGIPYVLLTGDTKDRAGPIGRFQAGAVPLFLISLKAGGVGLNLTAADTVIHYDPWWNPAVENQATDRAHRIGQDKPVFVHRLITAGTIEAKMEVLKQRKQALADGILGASAGSKSGLTEGDLEMLFSPTTG